ncbi:class B sortase [Lachnoanaerobaculum sp. Marseille-Q4761]|uniref:class B sortase n=1 Tax=Lachnoanaerobaculum sp. Marseille-Q4761 TaxID=2819511 RepID=UPI001AA12CC4|nr:class B sortase [Lachnoanaerobaculum sp. Marseille-Q4761]
MREKIRIILCCIFLAIAIYAAYNIIKIQSEYKKSVDAYKKLDNYTIEQTTSETSGESEEEPVKEKPYPDVDFAGLKSVNSDVIGWIYVPDTEINYPIVHTSDNDYYLDHLVDRTQNPAGAIFLDTRNPSDFSDLHSIIYGHHMKNGSMFAALKGYKKQDFFDGHKTGYLITQDAAYSIDFFAGHVANVEENAWQLDFDDAADFDNWIKSLKDISAFKSDIEPQYGDRIFTLSTCSYEFDDARFVLSGKLTKIE